MDEMKLLEAMRQIVKEVVKEELNPVNERLERLEQGQAKLEQGQEDIKRHITNNNVAIGEMFTHALETTNEDIKTVKAITANNLYKFEEIKLKEQG